MSRVLTFSRVFPGYHPRKGQPTDFVAKIWQSLYNQDIPFAIYATQSALQYDLKVFESEKDFDCKHHTCRSGKNWKVGDKFSPRVWSGKPYNSKQIIIAPDIEVKKVWDFEITRTDFEITRTDYLLNGNRLGLKELKIVAQNDGFEDSDDFELWFSNVTVHDNFKGQIICWNESIEY